MDILRIHNIDYQTFGKALVKELVKEDIRNSSLIPVSFKFNSNWNIKFTCEKCKKEVLISEDYENQTKTFSTFSNLNSKNYSMIFLEDIAKILSNLALVVINGVSYINRVDFNYQFEFQRISSFTPSISMCTNCDTSYLMNLAMSYPELPEKDNPKGTLGIIELKEIVLIPNEIKEQFIHSH